MPGQLLNKSVQAIGADQIAEQLSKKGIKVEEKFSAVDGVTAKVDDESLKSLQDQGFKVYDNSLQDLIPGLPKATYQSEMAHNRAFCGRW